VKKEVGLQRPIGIFDSGVGGLTVFHEVQRHLPQEDLIYFGDTARVPYGIKSAETVTRYAMEITTFLMRQEIKLLIVACNTASSVALLPVQSRFPIPIVGVLEPGARAAVKYSIKRKIGVIGTESTIGSSAYLKAIHSLDSNVEVFTRPCPLFVPLAEEGWGEHPLAVAIVREYLEDLRTTGIDTLVLGCTHYPLLKSAIGAVMGEEVRLVDSATETAQEVEELLDSQGLLRRENVAPTRTYYVTDSPERFRKVGERFLGQTLTEVEKVTI
jgi:glutamate racemase